MSSNLAKVLLKIAEKDLEASKVLYENKLYPQCVFYLQQSVEKMGKSFMCLVKNIVNMEEVLKKQISHKTLSIFEIILKSCYPEDMPLILFSQSQQKEIIEEKKSFYQYVNYLKELEKDNPEKLLNELDIDYTRKTITKLIENKELFFNRIKESIYIYAIREIYPKIKNLPEDKQKEQILKIIDKLERKLNIILKKITDVDLVTNLGIAFLELFILAFITYSHSSKSRYPENNFNPLKFYTDQHFIIKHFKYIYDVSSYTLYNLKETIHKFYKLKNELF